MFYLGETRHVGIVETGRVVVLRRGAPRLKALPAINIRRYSLNANAGLPVSVALPLPKYAIWVSGEAWTIIKFKK